MATAGHSYLIYLYRNNSESEITSNAHSYLTITGEGCINGDEGTITGYPYGPLTAAA